MTRRALASLPLSSADVAAIGRRDGYIQDILEHDSTSGRWAGIDHTARVGRVPLPVSSVGGWFDIFLPGQLRDFETLQGLGHPVRLTVRPWTHTSRGVFATGMKETVSFGLAHARGTPPPARAPVRLWVMGEEAWRRLARCSRPTRRSGSVRTTRRRSSCRRWFEDPPRAAPRGQDALMRR